MRCLIPMMQVCRIDALPLREDVHLLLTAVIADLEVLAVENRSQEVPLPAAWTAHRLRTMNQAQGDFDLAVQRARAGVVASASNSDIQGAVGDHGLTPGRHRTADQPVDLPKTCLCAS